MLIVVCTWLMSTPPISITSHLPPQALSSAKFLETRGAEHTGCKCVYYFKRLGAGHPATSPSARGCAAGPSPRAPAETRTEVSIQQRHAATCVAMGSGPVTGSWCIRRQRIIMATHSSFLAQNECVSSQPLPLGSSSSPESPAPPDFETPTRGRRRFRALHARRCRACPPRSPPRTARSGLTSLGLTSHFRSRLPALTFHDPTATYPMQFVPIQRKKERVCNAYLHLLTLRLDVVHNCRDRVARVLRLAHPSFADGGGKLLGLRYP